jgi:hypothetical protein
MLLPDQDSQSPADVLPAQVVPPAGSVLVSLLFWCSLTIAASAYAAVALSPKFMEWTNVRQQYRDNALHLQKLEQEVLYLERVAEALRTDPEFASRIADASITHAAVQSTVPNIPSSEDRQASYNLTPPPPPPPATQVPLLSPESLAIIRRLATSTQLRTQLLVAAAALTLLAFTLFNDAGGWLVLNTFTGGFHMAVALLRRYAPTPAHSPANVDTPEQPSST